MEQNKNENLEQEVRNSSKNFFRLWSPVIIHQLGLMAASMVMAFIVAAVYAGKYPDTVSKALDDNGLLQKLTETLTGIADQYTVITMGLASFVLIFVFANMYRKDKVILSKEATKNSAFKYLALIGISISVHFVLNNLIFVSGIDSTTEGYEELQQVMYSPSLGVQLVVLVVLSPLCEELVYRGLVYRRLRDRHGFVMAALLSSMVFSIVHGNLVQMIYAFCLGMLFAYLCEKFNTVIAPFAAHALMNLMSVCLTHFGFYDMLTKNIMVLMITTVIASGIGAIIFLRFTSLQIKK